MKPVDFIRFSTGGSVLYDVYQRQMDMMLPMRTAARAFQASMGWPHRQPMTRTMRGVSAALELFDHLTLSHDRPDFGVDSVRVGGRDIAVREEPITATPFGTLLRFRRMDKAVLPKVLVVAPLSGHFSTLLRNTVQTMLQHHDVYLTDWHNAREVDVEAGSFGFADYIDTVVSFLEYLGPDNHVVAVCQPCVQVLAAVAVMAETDHPCTPKTMTLMGGPIDVRRSPTVVNTLAFERPLSWFERNLISRVPSRYEGAGRRVYPGFVQIGAFMRMNLERHISAHRKLYAHFARNDRDAAMAIKDFYDEYFAVLDIPAEFYLETVDIVFQRALLAKGELFHGGRKVNPGAIRDTMLLTVEGERDDVCGRGQTAAAHELCTGIPDDRRHHHLQRHVGHYGIFSGRRWDTEIYPILSAMIARA
jgi:polyhydroxyalkanoate depolymerase